MATNKLYWERYRKVSIILSWIAHKNLRAVKYFLEPLPLHERCSIVSPSNSNQTSLLHYAVYKGSLNIVQYLIIDCGANVNTVYRGAIVSTTPLFIAICTGNLQMVRLLVKLGADLVWKNLSMENALVYTCKYQQIRMAIFLMKSGGKIESDRNIYLCAENVRYCIVSIMLGTSPNATDSKRDSIFILASEKGNLRTMNLLRQFNIDIYYRNQMCHNALSAAIWRKQGESYRYHILNSIYNDIDIALAFELCGARMILFQSRYDEAIDKWNYAVYKRMSVDGGQEEKLEYYRDNGIKHVKEFQTREDLQKLRGNLAACIEQAHLVYTRIRNPPGLLEPRTLKHDMNLPNGQTIFKLIISNNLNKIRSLLNPLTLHDRKLVVIQKINKKSLACHACELNFKEILKYFIDECGVGIENTFFNAIEIAPLISLTLQHLDLGMIVFLIRHGFRIHDYNVCYVINDILFNEHFSLSCILCLYKVSGQFTLELNIKNHESEFFTKLVSYDERSRAFLDATARGNLPFMKLLLTCGVNITLMNERYNNALCMAILNDQKKVEEYLLKHKIYTNKTYISCLELCGAKFIIFRSAKLKGIECWKQSLQLRKVHGFENKNIKPVNNLAEEFHNDQYFQHYTETDNGDIYRQALVVLLRLLSSECVVVHEAFAFVAQQRYFRNHLEQSIKILSVMYYFSTNEDQKSNQPSRRALCTLRNLFRFNFLSDLKNTKGYMLGIRKLCDFMSTSRWCMLLNIYDEFYRLAYTELVRTFLFQITLIVRYDPSPDDLIFVKNFIDDLSTRSSDPFPRFDENEFPPNIQSIIVKHSSNQKKSHDNKNQQNFAGTLFVLQTKKIKSIRSPVRERGKIIRKRHEKLEKVGHNCKQQ